MRSERVLEYHPVVEARRPGESFARVTMEAVRQIREAIAFPQEGLREYGIPTPGARTSVRLVEV
jgi:hypothetical protein